MQWVIEESITLCGPKDSGKVVWSSDCRCRGRGRALLSDMIRCCVVQSYTCDRCTSGVAGALLSQRHGEQWAVTASCTHPEARALRHFWPIVCYNSSQKLCLYTQNSLLEARRAF